MGFQRNVGNIIRFVLLSLLLLSFGSKAANTIDSVRVWPAPENTRVVFDLGKKPEYKYFTLTAPHRLVIDFENSKRNVNLANIGKNDPRIRKIRTSKSKKTGTTRLVLELNAKYKTTVFPLAPAGQYGHRLVIDLFDKEQKTHVAVSPPKQKQDIVIGIDAGHGGEDPGSIGNKGTYEKHVTLAIAKRLKNLIDKEKGLKAVLIRSGDYYIHVNDRSKIARKKNVDFLVSIHADAFRTPQPSGGSVWLVTNRRVESELSRWLVNREKNSELLGGGGSVIKNTADDNLAITIADMSKEYSLEVSHGVASSVISRMRKITKMHKRTPQNGNFAVLKASDIPSILVETGFISNHQEERNLISPKHQQKLAKSIFDGIRNYYLDNPPAGSYYATIATKKHTVSRGESLSVLAQRYNVSVSKLKKANNLRSNVVKVGQTLKIPRAD